MGFIPPAYQKYLNQFNNCFSLSTWSEGAQIPDLNIISGYFQNKLAFELMDWVKQMALPSVGDGVQSEPSHWEVDHRCSCFPGFEYRLVIFILLFQYYILYQSLTIDGIVLVHLTAWSLRGMDLILWVGHRVAACLAFPQIWTLVNETDSRESSSHWGSAASLALMMILQVGCYKEEYSPVLTPKVLTV